MGAIQDERQNGMAWHGYFDGYLGGWLMWVDGYRCRYMTTGMLTLERKDWLVECSLAFNLQVIPS